MDYPLDAVREVVEALHEEGIGYRKIAETLREYYGVETSRNSVARALKRWEKDENEEVDPRPTKLNPIEIAEGRFSEKKLEPVDQLKREIADKNAEIQRYRTLLNQYEKSARLDDKIEQAITSAIRNKPYSPVLKKPKPRGKAKGSHEMMLLVSDAHYPEIVDPAEAMGISYGPDICRARMQHLVDRTIRLQELHETNYPVDTLTVAVLGDMLSGVIHEELEITNAIPMAEALPDMAHMLHDMGSIFGEYFPTVNMIIMPGNHPRMTKKPRHKQKWNNFEYIMGKFVEGMADNYNVIVPKDIVYTHEIFDMKIGMTHGDGSKASSFAGIPFYGLKQRANANQGMRSLLGLDRLDMLVMGHFHQQLNWTEGDCHIFLNGAIKPGDEYSIVTRSSASDPVQCLLTFHEKHGWISTERIPLKDVK